jgi:hypothetical protein
MDAVVRRVGAAERRRVPTKTTFLSPVLTERVFQEAYDRVEKDTAAKLLQGLSR